MDTSPGQMCGTGQGRAEKGAQLEDTGQGRRSHGTQGTIPSPSKHPGSTDRGWLLQTCQQLLPAPPPANVRSTQQTEALLTHLPGTPTRVLNSKNSKNIQMVTYEMLSCIFLSRKIAAAPSPSPPHPPKQFLCQDEEAAPGRGGSWP